MDPELLTAFEAEFGVDIVEDFYESNEAMLAQLQAGASYDVIVPSDYMVGIMIQESLLTAINAEDVPDMVNLGERFTTLPYDEGNQFSAPYQMGRRTGRQQDCAR